MRIACYIDVTNLYHRLKDKTGNKLNYYKYYKYLQDMGEIVVCNCYSACISNNEEINKKFKRALEKIGYTFKTKEYNSKNFNVEITLDVLTTINKLIDQNNELNNVDMFVFGTADTSLIPLINYLLDNGYKVMILACGVSKKFKGTIPVEIPQSLLLNASNKESVSQ